MLISTTQPQDNHAHLWTWARLDWQSLLVILIAYWVTLVIYNLYLHPLADYPGPSLGRATLLWRFIHSSKGSIHLDIEKLHHKYGPVVRVSPNELSYGSVESWKAIYGHSNAERPTPVKAPFYEIFGAGFKSLCIGSERNPKRHGEMRKMLSAAFSQKSLLEQEHIISKTIDNFIAKIGQTAPPESEGINMTKWYEMVAFDILGEMAFGESFHSIENGKPHFWSEMIEEHLYFITMIDNLSRLGIAQLLSRLIPSILLVQNKNSEYSRQKVDKILAMGERRRDFISLLVDRVREGSVEKEEMTAHVSTMVVAGGETVSTFLGGTTFFLLRNPDVLSRLVGEIRASFSTYKDINAQAAQKLPYLQAVINEGLRIYPPGSQGFPRISPGFTLHNRPVPPGTEIYTSAWTVTHDPANFKNPMEFKPERWLVDQSTDVIEASQPFSLGPRACLGRNFAYMEVNLLLAKMLWEYDLELVNQDVDFIKDSQVFVMWWKPKLMVRFHNRAGKCNGNEGFL